MTFSDKGKWRISSIALRIPVAWASFAQEICGSGLWPRLDGARPLDAVVKKKIGVRDASHNEFWTKPAWVGRSPVNSYFNYGRLPEYKNCDRKTTRDFAPNAQRQIK